ncbi:MAG TPA: hypothetical protein VGZ48_05390 [Candidatus Acidoferrales bacterium]|jgi:hypothetical protein|nr:hypothetical protein [Candidatus Acidoferrales bacterium]
MVEALLNLAWLVIAIGAICVFRAVWRKHKATTLLEWVALGTFLFLLFPVISLTDDLHPELEIAEAATSTKHFLLLTAHGAAAQHHAPHPAGSHPAVLGTGQNPIPLAEFAPVVNLNVRVRSSAPPRLASGRAPPYPSV